MVPLPQQSASGLCCVSPAQLYENGQHLGSIKAIDLISANAGRLNLVFLLQIELPREIGLQQRQGMTAWNVYWQNSNFGKHGINNTIPGWDLNMKIHYLDSLT